MGNAKCSLSRAGSLILYILFQVMIMPTVYLSYAYLHMHVLAPYLGRGGYVVVQSLGHIQLSEILWATVHHVSLSFTISRSLLKLTPIELVVSSNHLILSSTSAPALSLSQHFPKGMLMANRHMKRCSASLISSAGQCSAAAQLCPTLCGPMNCSTPGLPVHHQLPEFTQTHVHRVSDAIQPSHPLPSPSPPAPNPSQHQSLFQ